MLKRSTLAGGRGEQQLRDSGGIELSKRRDQGQTNYVTGR